MAFLTTISCIVCGKSKHEVVSTYDYLGSTCSECRSKINSNKESIWKTNREELSLEERVRDLENFMYHHKEHSRLDILYG